MCDICVLYFTLTCISYTLCTIDTHTKSLNYYFQIISQVQSAFLSHTCIILDFVEISKQRIFLGFYWLLSSNKFILE